jgi:nucleoside-diphosphate-sugar epimerase
VRQRCEAAGVDWVVIRPPLVYGPGVEANFLRLINVIKKRFPLPLGAVRNRRSIISVANLAEATAAALEAPGAANQVLMISDATVSTPELLRAVAKALGVKAWLVPVPTCLLFAMGKLTSQAREVSRLCGNLEIDPNPSMIALGWRPSQSLDEAMRDTVAGPCSPSSGEVR